jgi:hypothetical protein
VTYTAKVLPDVETAEPTSARPWLRRLSVWALFIAITIAITWPSALVLSSRAIEHHDVFFNIWRLAWVHHALSTSPSSLFNANQFHPEPLVLAYSDAMLVEGLIAAPMFAAGLKPLLIHNLLLLGAIAASGIGMYALARHLWRNEAAAIVAGLVFAFAPYRFGHFMHMELQWTMWIPWAFWAMHRTLESGRAKFGILTGVFIALQMLSSVYYGIFLVVLLPVVGTFQFLRVAPAARLRVAGAFAAGAVLAIAVAAVYSKPYRAASDLVGVRDLPQIRMHSATTEAYRRVSHGNYLYGESHWGKPELSLFPGYVPIALGLAALVLTRPSALLLSYVAGLLLAFDLSLGLNGLVYPLLQEHVGVFKGLRAPARASIFFLLFLAALAARGCVAVLRPVPTRVRLAVVSVLATVLMLEYWIEPVRLERYPDRPPLYDFLARQPDGVVAQFPVPDLNLLPGHDARYAYMSIFHWKPMVNGYSGYYPASYLARMQRLATFPDSDSIAQLRSDGVRYVVVHEGSYIRASHSAAIVIGALREGLKPVARLHDGWAAASVFELSRASGPPTP